MNIGMIGLGRMGNALAQRIVEAGHCVTGFDVGVAAQEQGRALGVAMVDSVAAVAKREQIIWLMVPSGELVDRTIDTLIPHLRAGAIIIDGGNSFYKDSMRRAQKLAKHGIAFLDCGTSGGIRGRESGFCLMVGGDLQAYDQLQPIFKAVAAPQGYAHVGPSGAGHYVKMVHNGIEYALLQAYAEGFHVIKDGSFKDAHLDLEKISYLWDQSSVIRSFILTLAHDIFKEDQQLENVSGEVEATGMGLWAVEEARAHAIPAQTIEDALAIRTESLKTGGNYATKVVAMLRNKFGGHTFKKIKE
jgi:6-phosphogluconate dehydrogenase